MDIESESIAKCTELLLKLENDSRKRVLEYLLNRFQPTLDIKVDTFFEIEKIEEFLIENPFFTKTLILFHYPFSFEELLSLKKILPWGDIVVGLYLPKDEAYDNEDDFDEDGEYYDETAFEFEYGLLFNSNINWSDERVQALLLVPFGKYETRGEAPSIEFTMPITLKDLKEFELNNLSQIYTEQSQVAGYDYDYFVEQELSRLGISGYATDPDGVISDPPELALSVKKFLETSINPVNTDYAREAAKIETKYKVTNYTQLSIKHLQEIATKGEHYLLVNKTIWENTFSKIITKATLEKYLQFRKSENER